MQADDARAGVGDAEDLEQLLDGAVLAVAARAARRTRRRALGARSRATRSCADVDGDDLVAEALERVLDARAGPQRHLALERPRRP